MNLPPALTPRASRSGFVRQVHGDDDMFITKVVLFSESSAYNMFSPTSVACLRPPLPAKCHIMMMVVI